MPAFFIVGGRMILLYFNGVIFRLNKRISWQFHNFSYFLHNKREVVIIPMLTSELCVSSFGIWRPKPELIIPVMGRAGLATSPNCLNESKS